MWNGELSILSAWPLTLPVKPVVWVLFMLAFAQIAFKEQISCPSCLSSNINSYCKKGQVRFSPRACLTTFISDDFSNRFWFVEWGLFYFSSVACLNEEFSPSTLHVRWRVETLQEARAFSNLAQLKRGFLHLMSWCLIMKPDTFFLLLLQHSLSSWIAAQIEEVENCL